MKFFGWGRKKDPPPTRHDEVEKSDAGASARSMIRDPGIIEWGSRDPELLSKDHWLEGESMAAQEVAWEDKLQETIRFVFSHEQEGLLAIGTFALDQLAGACLDLDMIKPTTTTATSTKTEQKSCNNSTASMQVVLCELRSSDVDDSVPELFSPCKRKDLPVFGDHDELLPVVDTTIPLLPIPILKHSATVTDSPDLADTEGLATQNSTGVQQFHVPGVVPSSTENEEFSSCGGCGLFGSRSRRTQKSCGKEERKKLPPEKEEEKRKRKKKNCSTELNDVKKTDRSKGFRTSVARLWRLGCNRPPAEVTPEPDRSPRESSQMQVPGVPCIANVLLELPVLPKLGPSQRLQKVSEGSEWKRQGPNFGKGTWACAQNGKWIRTDSEFVVLEM